jgi:protein SCO1/2
MHAVLTLAWALLPAVQACAGELAFTPPLKPPEAGIEQHVGERLPLDLAFIDSRGERAPLTRFFGGDRPVLLVLGYYRCPQLCGLLMHGLLSGLHGTGLPASAYRIVRVSVDPQDTPQTAAARRSADLRYAAFLNGDDARTLPELELLTGEPGAIRRLAAGIGWRYSSLATEPNDPEARFAHPATAVIVTPDGRIARYLNGLQFRPEVLGAAIQDAASDRVGGGATNALALLCAHFDPRLGRHSAMVMATTRLVGLLLVLALAVWWWSPKRLGDRSRTG